MLQIKRNFIRCHSHDVIDHAHDSVLVSPYVVLHACLLCLLAHFACLLAQFAWWRTHFFPSVTDLAQPMVILGMPGLSLLEAPNTSITQYKRVRPSVRRSVSPIGTPSLSDVQGASFAQYWPCCLVISFELLGM